MVMAFVQDDLFAAPQDLPQGLRYEPGFVTPAEQAALVAQIETLPLREAKFREYFARRRVAHFHDGAAATAYDDGAADSVDHGPVPPWLAEGFAIAWLRILACPHREIVHVLVSEYRPGTPIGWHRDKPVYGVVAGISLGWNGSHALSPIRSAGCGTHAHARSRARLAVRDARVTFAGGGSTACCR